MRLLKSFPHRANQQRKSTEEKFLEEVPTSENKMVLHRFHGWERERRRNSQGDTGIRPSFSCLFSRYSYSHALYLAFSHKIVTQVLTHVATNPCNRIYNGCVVSMAQIHCNSFNHCPLVGCFGCFSLSLSLFPL